MIGHIRNAFTTFAVLGSTACGGEEGRAALLLGGATLPAGEYEWIRLIVDSPPSTRDSYIVLASGAECELNTASFAAVAP